MEKNKKSFGDELVRLAKIVEIMEEGFNMNSGYMYISLENGVTIASAFGQAVDFIIYDDENEEEIFFDSIEELNAHLNDN